VSCDRESELPGAGADAGQTVLYRDTWGVAHIYSPTIEGGMYAMGYAQAQDRPQQLLHNLLIAIGEYASVVGEQAVPSDLRSLMWDHYGISRRALPGLRAEVRGHLDAFVAGINAFYDEHPEDRPEVWGDRPVDAAMILAFGRLFLYNWSIDEAYEDLERAGIEAGYDEVERGSNQFAVSPARSAEGAAILAIDPHLSWFGPSRFWELRIHAGELEGSGVTLAGSPYIGLGHNRHVAWAMTTGGPDTADVYELELRDGKLGAYRYDGEWREMIGREVTVAVADGEPQTHTLWFSHHGPIVAVRDGVAYAAKIAYGDLVTLDAWYELNLARDYTGVVRALEGLTLFPQNVMAADTAGNIYYQRTGRVPVRPDGFDWALPVDGSTSTTEWSSFHSASEHLQVLNPEQGYMQNCNIPPDAMMIDSPFRLADHRDYLFSGPGYGQERAGWTNQRGARAVELLAADDSVSAEEAMAYINDLHPYGIERWLAALAEAHAAFGSEHPAGERLRAAVEQVAAWDGRLARDSQPALIVERWRAQLAGALGPEAVALEQKIDDWYAIVEDREPKEVALAPGEQRALLDALARALDEIADKHGSLTASYGDRHRVGREAESWPLGGGGGGQRGMTTLRNVSYGPERDDDHTRWGRSGQTSTQVVVLSTPPRSYLYLPLGQSDRPESPHYDDQAERAFSPGELKPSWWLPEELASNVASREVLPGAP
jgi:acyl-homoserine lactone acylase PvdQ